MQGKIIFLNGTSSSGKTTIAELLQNQLNEPYFILSIDSYISSIKFPELITEAKSLKHLPITTFIAGFHGAIKSMANLGLNIIIDHVLQEEKWVVDIKDLINNKRTIFVGVFCSFEELERREKLRKDREVGLAKYQFERVHKNKTYAIEVDTSELKPQECVDKILSQVNSIK
ncbi:MAG: chloramphenicol phosphotransferase CPT family protein [Candidatus Heimdallarchaeota archaeon]